MHASQHRKTIISTRGFLFFVFLLFIIGLIHSIDQANAEPLPSEPGMLIFGPITLQREYGKPETKSFSFTISDASGPFLLHVANGTIEGTHRVSSAVIRLNSKEIISPSEFNQKVSNIYRQTTLLSGENSLDVRLRSVPGSYLTLAIYRLGNQACPIFGPRTFIRKTGKPVEERVIFESTPELHGPFTMNLMNGDAKGFHRVDSASIKLNGELIFGPSSFNERVQSLSEAVLLQSTNILSVELRGKPGDFLTIEITGYDNIPPSVRITSPSHGAILSTSPITVRGIVDDSASTVTVNGASVAVAPDGSFSVEGIALQEGENPIEVVAVDACGNRGEDQVLVYFRTGQQGPQLALCVIRNVPTVLSMEDEDCRQEVYAWNFGSINGYTDETAVSVTLNGISLPDRVEIIDQGIILWGLREGTYFYADIKIPEIDGVHPVTAMATDANGNTTKATVYFIRDTIPPHLTITSPSDGLITNSPTLTITGTVDDPEAIVRIGWYTEIPVVNGTFSTEITLDDEGVNYIWITAEDPAWNLDSAFLQIILDTIPPQINVTNPLEGVAFNTPSIQVTGAIIDQNIDSITVSVNHSQPQPLALAGSGFSGTITLSPGSNALTFHATDKAGNMGSFTRSVLLDLELPIIAIISPQLGSVISGMTTVAVEAIDSMSGITSVTLYVDGQAQATLNHLPFSFTLNTSLFASGMHTITVKAIDRAGNQAEAHVSVTIDNTAPIVAITTPQSGDFVSGLITVSVQASDPHSGITSVSLYVDGQLLAILTQPPFNFPLNTLLFSSGSHTLMARGIDSVGNQAEASIPILFDHIPPTVSITSPLSGTTVSGTIAVAVDANDTLSGVASVSLYLNHQLQSTLNQPPYKFTVDTSALAPGPHPLTVRAIDRVGNQAEASITIRVSHLRAEIIYPVNGATVNKSEMIVFGKIHGQTGETGVVVNGVLAEVQGGDFAAVVPLQTGQNIITAIATTVDGFQVQTSVTISTTSQEEMIRFTVYPGSGIIKPPSNTLEVTFDAEAYLPNPVVSYSWDFNGDGVIEIIGPNPSVTAQYQSPGLYFPKVTVTDNQGNTFTETAMVNVLSGEEMDVLLRSKWEGMKTALAQGNISEALDYFITDSRDEYREIFELLASQLTALVSAMREINMVEIQGNMAEYYIKRLQRGVDISYFIYFMRDRDGIWKISSF